MPVERVAMSVSQLAELLGVDPGRFVAVEKVDGTRVALVLEPEEAYGADVRHHPAVDDRRETHHTVTA